MKALQKLFDACMDNLVEKEELITRLELENSQLKARLDLLEAAHQAESSERECDAYNL